MERRKEKIEGGNEGEWKEERVRKEGRERTHKGGVREGRRIGRNNKEEKSGWEGKKGKEGKTEFRGKEQRRKAKRKERRG